MVCSMHANFQVSIVKKEIHSKASVKTVLPYTKILQAALPYKHLKIIKSTMLKINYILINITYYDKTFCMV